MLQYQRRGRWGTHLVGGLAYSERTTDVGRAAAVYNSIVHDEIAHCADRVVQRALSLVNDLKKRAGGNVSIREAHAEGPNAVRTILLLPRTKTVTVRALAHSSITSILSRVVPKVSSRTMPARPSFSAVRSSKRGTIRPLVAMAIN